MLERNIFPRITAAAAAAGRPAPQVIASLPVMVSSEPDARRQSIAAAFAIAIAEQVPAYRSVLDTEGVASVADVSIVGNEEEVAAQLRRLAQAGVTEFAGFLYGGPTPLRAPPHYWREFGCEATDIGRGRSGASRATDHGRRPGHPAVSERAGVPS